MAGRTAEREGGTLAALDECRRRQRDIVGRLDRVPGATDEIGAGVEGIVAEQRVDRRGAHVAAQPSRRPCKGHCGARAAALRPQVPDRGQEGDVIGTVDAPCGIEGMDVGLQDRPQPLRLHPPTDILRPRGHFEGWHDRARHQFDISGVAGVQRRKHCLHKDLPIGRREPSRHAGYSTSATVWTKTQASAHWHSSSKRC